MNVSIVIDESPCRLSGYLSIVVVDVGDTWAETVVVIKLGWGARNKTEQPYDELDGAAVSIGNA